MDDLPLIIDERPRGVGPRTSAWLRGRRFMLSGALALVELIAFMVWRPSTLLIVLLAALVLALSVAAAVRLRPGAVRDVLWIVALAQAYLVVVPLVIGFSLAIGLVLAAVLLVALVVVAFRYRF
jgi:hypothetical protein